MINDYIHEICYILNIEPPEISFDTSHFPSKTTMAQCSIDGSKIYLMKCEELGPDQYFAVAHELRHIWQIRTDEDLYFGKYKTADLCASLEEYNLQIAEIDANAFALVAMSDFFHIEPLFDGLSDAVKSKIHEHIQYVLDKLV